MKVPLRNFLPAPSHRELVMLLDGQAVTTTIAIAAGTSTTHEAVIKLVRAYRADLEEFGMVRFEIQPRSAWGGVPQLTVTLWSRLFAQLPGERLRLGLTIIARYVLAGFNSYGKLNIVDIHRFADRSHVLMNFVPADWLLSSIERKSKFGKIKFTPSVEDRRGLCIRSFCQSCIDNPIVNRFLRVVALKNMNDFRVQTAASSCR